MILSAEPAVVPPPFPGSPRYRVGREIGRGGIGIVYEGTDLRLNRKVAIKVLPEGSESAERRRRFLLEAQAASKLNHPHIVTIHDVDAANGVDFIVMEYVDGAPLHQLIPPGGLPLDQMLDYGRQIASALAAAHGAGIVHRDLKPANVMLARDGRIKVLDFGLSKLLRLEVTSTQMTRSSGPETVRGLVMGSAGYMSPEQAMGEAADARSDVFSLGVVFFEMASGRLPFPGNDLRALLHDSPKPILEIRPDIPPALAAAIDRCLEKDPSRGYSTAIDLARDLNSVSGLQADTAPAPSRRRFGASATIAAAVVVALATGVAAWVSARRAQVEREYTDTVNQVEQLADVGRYVDVWRVRLKTAILLSGGLVSPGLAPEVDPLNFMPRASLPVLMLGGRYDFSYPIETAQKPMFDLFGTPAEHKRFVIFEDAGHVPPRIEVIREVLDWLDRYLGPVQR